MAAKHKYIMMILDALPDTTTRIWYWNRQRGLTQSIRAATRFDTADDCQRAFDDDGGDSFLQGENGDILTYDKNAGDMGDYTYERYIVTIGG